MPTRIVDGSTSSNHSAGMTVNSDGSINVRQFSVGQSSGINVGYLNHTSTTGATTLLTVAAGKTWVGQIAISVSGSKVGAATGNGNVKAVIATAGANVTPAAGTVLACDTEIGANVAAGTVGTQSSNAMVVRFVVVAPAANAVTLTLASTLANVTQGSVDVSAIGENY